jgi:hypothetical protein
VSGDEMSEQTFRLLLALGSQIEREQFIFIA